MKYIVRKPMPGAKVGDILQRESELPLGDWESVDQLRLYENKYSYRVVLVNWQIEHALDQGFIEPYEEE